MRLKVSKNNPRFERKAVNRNDYQKEFEKSVIDDRIDRIETVKNRGKTAKA